MTNQHLDLAIAAALLGFAAALWWWLIPAYAGAGEQVILPRLLAAVIAGLAAMMLAVNLRPARSRASHPQDDDPFLELGGGEAASGLALAAVWGVFCFTLGTLGFYLGGALTLAASYLLLGFRQVWLIGAWTGGTLLAVYLVFEAGFQLVIRPGTLERLLLTLW